MSWKNYLLFDQDSFKSILKTQDIILKIVACSTTLVIYYMPHMSLTFTELTFCQDKF